MGEPERPQGSPHRDVVWLDWSTPTPIPNPHMPTKYDQATKDNAFRVMAQSASDNKGAPVWAHCARSLGINRRTLKGWWREGVEGEARIGRGVVAEKRLGTEVSAADLLNMPAAEAREWQLKFARQAYEDAESDAGRTGALKEVNRLVEAYGRGEEGARILGPREWVEEARECPELLWEAVMGCEEVLRRVRGGGGGV